MTRIEGNVFTLYKVRTGTENGWNTWSYRCDKGANISDRETMEGLANYIAHTVNERGDRKEKRVELRRTESNNHPFASIFFDGLPKILTQRGDLSDEELGTLVQLVQGKLTK
jgi:hypothetical protein